MRLDGLADYYMLSLAEQDVKFLMRKGAQADELLCVLDDVLDEARGRFGLVVETTTRESLREWETGTPIIQASDEGDSEPREGYTFALVPAHKQAIRLRTLQHVDNGNDPADAVWLVQQEADASCLSAINAILDHARGIIDEELKAHQDSYDNQVDHGLRVRPIAS